MPTETLNSIWSTLKEREQVVLRAMAETVKPETETQIADYLSDRFNYNNVAKALRTLRSVNLIVLKRRSGGTDVLELHPLVGQFIHQSFASAEQMSFPAEFPPRRAHGFRKPFVPSDIYNRF